MGFEGTKVLPAEGLNCSVKVPIYEYMEMSNPCQKILQYVASYQNMNCYYSLQFC